MLIRQINGDTVTTPDFRDAIRLNHICRRTSEPDQTWPVTLSFVPAFSFQSIGLEPEGLRAKDPQTHKHAPPLCMSFLKGRTQSRIFDIAKDRPYEFNFWPHIPQNTLTTSDRWGFGRRLADRWNLLLCFYRCTSDLEFLFQSSRTKPISTVTCQVGLISSSTEPCLSG